MELKNTDTNELEPHVCMDKFANECNKFAISIVDHAYGEEKGNEHMIEQFCCVLRAGLKWLKCENVPLKEVKNNIPTVFDDI